MNAEPAEPALVICPHCHGWTCEDCRWQGVLVSELIEADVIDGPQLGDPAELPEGATITLGEILAKELEDWDHLVSANADGGAAEAEVVVPAQRDVVGLAGLSLPGVPTAVRAAVEAELVEAELLKAELAELAELRRDGGGGEAGGGFGGSEGSGLGVHLRSVGGAGRERGVPCGVCLVETWNVCAICDSCHSECRLAR